jgi:GntR family transcriptional repressor for pyruvate dehydrogenase complex
MSNKIFSPLENRELLSKIVASKIEEAIRSKKYLVGDKLSSEIELCNQFGVSRTAVREALRTLSAKGLISVLKGKGIFVRESSSEIVTDHMQLYLQLNVAHDYVIDIVRARQMIEPSLAAFAALNHSNEDKSRLHQDIEDLKKCDGGFVQLAKLDMRFHLDIAKASQNSIMPLILDPIHKLIPEIKSSVYATNKDAKESAVIWHQKILDEIIRKDADGARRAMVQHLNIAEEHAEIMLKSKMIISKK